MYIPPSFLRFHIPNEVFNFADDNTLYSSNKELETMFKNLENNFNVLSWFNFKSKSKQISINGSGNNKNKIESNITGN